MKTIWLSLNEIASTTIELGWQGENDHTQVRFCSQKMAEYTHTMEYVNAEKVSYPVELIREGDDLVWDIKKSDVVAVGSGEYQLTFTKGTEVIKSDIGKTIVNKSLIADGEAPDPIEDWIDRADEKLDEVEGAVDEAIAEIDDKVDEAVEGTVDDWLSENITNPSNPPLDRSLSLANAAAPADMVGDLLSALNSIGLDIDDGILVISPVTE